MEQFNDYIADLGLCEVDRVGDRFTWTNRQAYPTCSILGRVLISPEWELRCPLASLKATTRIVSDHVPLLFSSEDERPPQPPRFRFEVWGTILGRDLRMRKQTLLSSIHLIDLRADGSGLFANEWLLCYDLEDQLSVIYADEEAYWRM
ncbi:hypothetical protein D1007_52070 [Hordeum vulgare]|nr:hypothetical protein D1007_52070 [Hordeum vulgare]